MKLRFLLILSFCFLSLAAFAQPRLIIYTQLEKSLTPYSILTTDSLGNPVYLLPGSDGEVLGLSGGIFNWQAAGTTESGDGNTLIGDGTIGNPFRVDTSILITSTALLDTLQVFRDSLSTGVRVVDNNTIIGDGSGGNPLRVDTGIVVTNTALLDTLQAFRDTLSVGAAVSGDGNTITGNGQIGNEFKVDTSLIATIGGLLDTLQVFSDSLTRGATYVSEDEGNLLNQYLGFVRDYSNADSTMTFYDARIQKFVPVKREIYANDFGFHPDSLPGSNHVNFQNAIDYHIAKETPTTIHLSDGVYRVGSLDSDAVDNEIWNIEQTSDLTIKGAGKGKTIIVGERDHVAAATARDFVRIRNAFNIKFEGITFQSEFNRPIDMVFADAENSADSSMINGIATVVKSASGNNSYCNDVTVKDCEFKYLYGICLYINDAGAEGVTVKDSDFIDCYRDVNATSEQPTGILIDGQKDFIVSGCTFTNIIDLGGSLSHSLYLSGSFDGGIVENNTLEITYDQFTPDNNGSGGLQTISGTNENLTYRNNKHKNVTNKINNLKNCYFEDNKYFNSYTSFLNSSSVTFTGERNVKTKDYKSFQGTFSVSGDTYDINYINNSWVYPDTFTSPETFSHALMWKDGVNKFWTVEGNTFTNVQRPLWLGRNAGSSIDSSYFGHNLYFPRGNGRQMIYVQKANENRFEFNKVFASPNSSIYIRVFRDGDDGDDTDEIGNVLYGNEMYGTSEALNQSVNNATVYYDYIDSNGRNIGTRDSKDLTFKTNDAYRLVLTNDGKTLLKTNLDAFVVGTEADGEIVSRTKQQIKDSLDLLLSFSQLIFADSTTTITATGGGATDIITNASNNLFENSNQGNYTAQGDSIIISEDGLLSITVSFDVTGGVSSAYVFKLIKNGTPIENLGSIVDYPSESIKHAGFSYIYNANDGDVLKLGFEEIAGTTDPQFRFGSVSITKL